jgi:hypothetical protein
MRTTPKGKYKIYAIAEQGNSTYGAREYHLIPLQLFTASSATSLGRTTTTATKGHRPPPILLNRRDINEFRVASLYATKNVLIGAWCKQPYSLVETCASLVDLARKHAETNGEQVQALAALHGLCPWIAKCMSRNGEGSLVLSNILQKNSDHETKQMLENLKKAIESPAEYTTMFQGPLWEALVREFCDQSSLAKEVELYKSKGAVLVDVVHMAETTDESYMKSAAGSMVRMYFVS